MRVTADALILFCLACRYLQLTEGTSGQEKLEPRSAQIIGILPCLTAVLYTSTNPNGLITHKLNGNFFLE